MEFLNEKKNHLKERVDKLYQYYGNLCATHPLPLISSSVIIVLICSLPLLSHPVFERTMTFLFGRIQLGKYKTNISAISDKAEYKSTILVRQIKLTLNVTILDIQKNENLDTWTVFQRVLETSGVNELNHFCKSGESFNWTASCLHVSRKPFYKSPQTRLIYPRGRFHKELRKWFSKPGCLLVSPSAIYGIDEKKFKELPEPFKELLFGYPLDKTGLTTVSSMEKTFQFCFTISFFLAKVDERFISSVKRYFQSKHNASITVETNYMHQIKYLPIEDGSHSELLLLSMTYVLVFFYILFSVGKISMLKSRWGLAFSAVMTIIMSMIMALGVCAALDLLPTILTVTEIFPYVVIVIGLENVLTITKSVALTPGDVDVSVRVAKGMGKEGWYISKNLFAELTILGAGYFTWIPSLQEFCIFAYVGVLSDFFIQMVFFAPVLAVDVRRAERKAVITIHCNNILRTVNVAGICNPFLTLNRHVASEIFVVGLEFILAMIRQSTRFTKLCHLEQITIGQEFAVGFNLMQKTALTLVPPSPPKTRWSNLRSLWARKRLFQKAMMAAVVVYILYAVYHKIQDANMEGSKPEQNAEKSREGKVDDSYTKQMKPPKGAENVEGNLVKKIDNSTQNVKQLKQFIVDSSERYQQTSSKENLASWNFLSKQHWPELLTFYHIRFSEKSIVVQPPISVQMTVQLNLTDPNSGLKFTKTSTKEDLFLIVILTGCIACLALLIWLAVVLLPRRQRRLSRDTDVFEQMSRLYSGHNHSIEFLCASESYIVAVSIVGCVKVWNTESHSCVMEVSPSQRISTTSNVPSQSFLRQRKSSGRKRFGSTVNSVPACSIWCLDCKHGMLAMAVSTGMIEVYSINNRRSVGQFEEEEAVVLIKVASRNTVLVGRLDGIIDIVEIKRNQMDSIADVEIGCDDYAEQIETRNYLGCHIKHRIKAHIGPIDYLESVSGLLICSSADLLKVYEIDDSNCCNSVSKNGLRITCMHKISKIPGLSVASGYEDGSIAVFNTSGEISQECNWHDNCIEIICSNNKQLASLDADKTLCIWSPEGKAICSISKNVMADTFAMDFISNCVLCTVSEGSLLLIHSTVGHVLQKIQMSKNNFDCSNSDLICFPEQNSVSIAKGTTVEVITFPNINKLKMEQADAVH